MDTFLLEYKNIVPPATKNISLKMTAKSAK